MSNRTSNRTSSRKTTSGPGRLILSALALAMLAVLVGSCAYFNLFYNAEDAFNEGERIGEEIDPRDQPTSQQRTQYNRAIAKCRMLLDEYPDSGLVDDALFLMGKSFYRMHEWSEAVRNFENMLVNFPASDHAEEATFLLSISYLSRGDDELGLQWFAKLKEAWPDGQYAAEALYRLGDAWATAGRTARAIKSYEEFLVDYGDRSEAAPARVALARLQLDESNPEAALAALEDFRVDDPNTAEATTLRYDARTLRTEALIALERYDEALAAVEVLDSVADTDARRREAVLLRGRVLLLTGQIEAGRKVLSDMVKAEGLQPEATSARKISIEFFSAHEGPESEHLRDEISAAEAAGRMAGPDATHVRDHIVLLATYDRIRERYDAADSTSAAAAFALGEMVLTEYDRPFEAHGWYAISLELDPVGPSAARALYALGWLSTEFMDDPQAGEDWYARLEECCPDSPQARALRGEVFVSAKPRTRAELERMAGSAGGLGPGADDGIDLNDPRNLPWRSLRNGGPGALGPREAGL